MPTGYTEPVQNGKITTLRDFAMSCARAFGACIDMRDDPSDAPIPENFAPAPYYSKRVEEARAELDLIRSMSDADMEKAFEDARREDDERITRLEQERSEQRARYEAMLAKVEAWSPPTPEHKAFHDFMLSQLRGSIDFDCRWSPERKKFTTAENLWRERLKDALRDLADAEKSLEEEIERQAKRTKWIADLRHSLGESA